MVFNLIHGILMKKRKECSLIGLQLTNQARLVGQLAGSQGSSCVYLPSRWITKAGHHTQSRQGKHFAN